MPDYRVQIFRGGWVSCGMPGSLAACVNYVCNHNMLRTDTNHEKPLVRIIRLGDMRVVWGEGAGA